MPANVRGLRTPPVVGQNYMVECVFGTVSNIGPHTIPPRWWPVFTPSHQDSVYFPRYRTIWNQEGEAVDETYYEDDAKTPHHHHVDPRFTRDEFYTPYEVENKSYHVTIRPEGKVEMREMMCTREMPIQILFTGFGKNFLDEHKEAKLRRCKVCPHKGTPLASMPVVDGKITCPAHGLQFDYKTERCVSVWPD